MKNCLIIFAREPEAGKVKTRMERHLSAKGCVELYKAFLRDTVKIAKRVQRADKVLAYASSAPEPLYLKKIARDFKFYRQKGNSLGKRMHNAFEYAAEQGRRKVVIIGSDSPSLPSGYIKEAFKALDKSDLVLGPAADGGYYLIGLKKPCADLFKSVKWGSGSVLARTVKNAKLSKKRIALIKSWRDIDDASGLARLKRDLTKGKCAALWTKRFLEI